MVLNKSSFALYSFTGPYYTIPLVFSSSGGYFRLLRLCFGLHVSPLNATLLMVCFLSYLLKTLNPSRGEGILS